MVGFVMIILLVAVIFLIFLGIFLRRGGSAVESGEAAQFLDALEEVTTECKQGFSYLNVRQLVKKCYENDLCEPTADGVTDSCVILEDILKDTIESSCNFDTERYTKAYRLEARYETRSGGDPVYFIEKNKLSKGTCSEEFRGAEKAISVNNGIIYLKLELCY